MAKKIDTNKFYKLTKKKAAIESAIWQVNEKLACKGFACKDDIKLRKELYEELEKVEKALDEMEQS